MPKWIAIILMGISSLGISMSSPQEQRGALYPIEHNGRWGYINEKGKIVVEPQFDHAWDFSEGCGRVETKGKQGFIDKFGRIVAQPKFDNAGDFSFGRAPVQKGEIWGYIDGAGRMVIQREYPNKHWKEEWAVEELPRFSDGVAVIVTSGGTDFIDQSGKVVTHLKEQVFTSFSEGLGLIEMNSKYGWIDKSGKTVIKPQFDYAKSFSEGLAAVRFGRGSWEGKPGDKWAYIALKIHTTRLGARRNGMRTTKNSTPPETLRNIT